MGYSIFENTMVDMTWIEIEKSASDGAIVLLPTGVIEEHGPHMCTGVDTYLSYSSAVATKKRLEEKGIKAVIAPPFYWGMCNATAAFPGTFVIRTETVKALIYDILSSLKRWGFEYIFCINCHFDQEHCMALMEAIKEACTYTGIRGQFIIPEIFINRFGVIGDESYILVEKQEKADSASPERPEYIDIHAGAGETAAMYQSFPGLVDAETIKELEPTNLGMKDLMIWRNGWSDAQRITPMGYFGDPAGYYKLKNITGGFSKDKADLIEEYLSNR